MTDTRSVSPALRTPPAAPAEAVAFFAARLAFQADVSDVNASLASGDPGFVLVDSRGDAGWRQGRVPGAVHLPTADIPTRAASLLDPAIPVITYCWGPGCDGATRAALALARLGHRVKEMIGGIEYWIREGLPVETANGTERRAADPLTVPVSATAPAADSAVSCDC
ncbi:rhodanese-like domain-containing protein [Streptomyces hainanensis]|uniref:Rhodanese-like domain-containing protein n=1 Tax=Streptomyces hainanensis TaxID=402648 RepID=A0A4R4SFT7_9ACTN|nr:rhodanese-like domain-containing protein [Streptomyces hainanensis]TDC62220.1 rhodanese-like domain-containing protein [Streptomyces hainanensis]